MSENRQIRFKTNMGEFVAEMFEEPKHQKLPRIYFIS